jgi:hypothetical protein
MRIYLFVIGKKHNKSFYFRRDHRLTGGISISPKKTAIPCAVACQMRVFLGLGKGKPKNAAPVPDPPAPSSEVRSLGRNRSQTTRNATVPNFKDEPIDPPVLVVCEEPVPPSVVPEHEPKRSSGLIEITAASVRPIKKSIAQKFDVNVPGTLPLIVRSSLNIVGEELSKHSQVAIEKLETANSLIRQAKEETLRLSALSEQMLTKSAATLTEMRKIRTETETVKQIPKSFAGRVLVLVISLMAMLLGVLNYIKTGILSVCGFRGRDARESSGKTIKSDREEVS